MKKRSAFNIALTADFFNENGSPKYRDMGLSVLDQAGIKYRPFEEHRLQINADQIGDAQGVIVLAPSVVRETISRSDNLLAIGRFGVGYDAVDVNACTEADVAVFITVGAVDRSVAEATVAWMLALSHHVRVKDHLVRKGKWDERSRYMGCELRDRTFGAIGMGGIARETIRLLQNFGMNPPLAYDPYMDRASAEGLGVRKVELDELLQQADFVSIHCPLTDQTRGLIGKNELGLMKSNAYLINTARGWIVDEDALYSALSTRSIAGAAVDCFMDEPLANPHRFGELDNVLLAPHSIAWTNEMFRDIGHAVCQGMVDLSQGKRPKGVVNSMVFEKKSFQEKWAQIVHPKI